MEIKYDDDDDDVGFVHDYILIDIVSCVPSKLPYSCTEL